MQVQKNKIVQAFLEMRKKFPFGGGYVSDAVNKYIAIASQIMKDYPPGSKILSIGSGPCDLEAMLSILGYSITAIDDLKDPWHLIGKNRERIKDFAKQMNIELIIQSAGSPQLKENYFDVVLLVDVMPHLSGSPRELLNYSISLLKPDGLLLIETANAAALFNRVSLLFGKSDSADIDFFYWNIGKYRGHVKEYTRYELKYVLSHHNLNSIDSRMMNIMIDMVKSRNFLKKIVVKMYKLICRLYPNFRDVMLFSGKKPKDWLPTDNSIKTLKKYYPHIEKYNLDNEPDEVLINKIIQGQKEYTDSLQGT